MSSDHDPTEQHALIFTGPGSQPGEEDGAELDYMVMPQGMSVFSAPDLPEADELDGRTEAIAVLARIADALANFTVGQTPVAFDVSDLDDANRTLLDQVLGEGEVSMIAGSAAQAQEAVFAGVWRVRLTGTDGRLLADTVEIGPFPRSVLRLAFSGARERLRTDGPVAEGVANAPALVTEINAELADRMREARAEPHVINLSLLPLTEQDVTWLGGLLGFGGVTVLSRGYGNCRIQATAVRGVWAVQFFNSQDTLILNTIEITDVPLMACAAQEDIDDSARRLASILKVYQ